MLSVNGFHRSALSGSNIHVCVVVSRGVHYAQSVVPLTTPHAAITPTPSSGHLMMLKPAMKPSRRDLRSPSYRARTCIINTINMQHSSTHHSA